MKSKIYRIAQALFLLASVLSFTSCGNEEADTTSEKTNEEHRTSPEKDRERAISLKEILLQETGICTGFQMDSLNKDLSCVLDTNFVAIHRDSSLSSGFVLMAKYLNEDIQTLRTYVFVRMEDGHLKMANEFDAILFSYDSLAPAYTDVLLRFIEPYKEDKFFYNCWFTYSLDEMKYIYKDCHSINRESKNGNYLDVYVSEKSSPDYRKQTDREVYELLSEYGLID